MGSGVLGGVGLGDHDVEVAEEAFGSPHLLPAVEKRCGGVDVVVLEVNRLEGVVFPADLLARHVFFADQLFGDPVEPVAHLHGVSLEVVEGSFPFGKDPVVLIGFTFECLACFEVAALEIEGGNDGAVLKLEKPLEGVVSADVP